MENFVVRILLLLFVMNNNGNVLRCGQNYNLAKINCDSICTSVLDCLSGEWCWIIADYDDECTGNGNVLPTIPPTSLPTISPISPTPLPVTSPTEVTQSPSVATPSPTSETPSPTLSTPSPTSTTLSPTPNTNSPVAASPTSSTPLPTSVTPSPTLPTLAPNSNGNGTPCPTSTPYRCGTSWTDANSKCGTCCLHPGDCPTGELCYAGVSDDPCSSASVPTIPTASPIPQPTNTTPIPTSNTPAPVFQPTLSTQNPVIQPTASPATGNIQTIMSCGNGKYVSLTFDDGPTFSNQATQTIIDALNNAGIKGTFYLSPAAFGSGTTQLTQRCALVQQLVNNGHEVQSHSWAHGSFPSLTNEEIVTELTTVSDWIYQCSGNQIRPTIFRPPYGELTKDQAIYINSLGYIIGLWNLDSQDWRSPNNYDTISSYINVDNFNDKSINLLTHDRNIYQIIDDIILLFNNGYQFITQSECYHLCDTLDSYGICRDPTGYTHYAVSGWGL